MQPLPCLSAIARLSFTACALLQPADLLPGFT